MFPTRCSMSLKWRGRRVCAVGGRICATHRGRWAVVAAVALASCSTRGGGPSLSGSVDHSSAPLSAVPNTEKSSFIVYPQSAPADGISTLHLLVTLRDGD